MKTILIGCRCGAVEIEISGEPLVQMYCHCDDCQAVHLRRMGRTIRGPHRKPSHAALETGRTRAKRPE